MDEKPVTADVVVACVAGFGAWAGFEQMVQGESTYAAELFGKATNLTYPLNIGTVEDVTDRTVPTVMLTLKGEELSVAPASKAAVKFMFSKAEFAEAILPGALVCETTTDAFANDDGCGTESLITIVDGGAKGDSNVTFEVTVGDAAIPITADGESQVRLVLTVPQLRATGAVTVATSIATSAGNIPPVVNACPVDNPDTKAMNETDPCNKVVKTAQAVTAMGVGGGVQAHIHLDDFKMLAPMAGKARESVSLGSYTFNVDNKGGNTRGPDGNPLNEDAAATLTITVEGDLNEGDVVKVGGADPKDLTVAASGEGVSTLVTLSSAEPGLTALKSSKKVDLMYMPAGKDRLSHGAEIDVHFMPRFTRVENTSIKAEMRTTTLKLSGVGSEVRAYALPHADNGKMDRANVRIRCEDGDRTDDNMCRVFVECWDDMGMGDIGEVGKIAEGALKRLDSEEMEMYSGVDPEESRLSCRVLATGEVTVQSLVRDGPTGVLVNNTTVGGM